MGSRGSSLVDYCIVNVELLSDFSAFYVHDPNALSDHCLVEFSLTSNFVPESQTHPVNEEPQFHYYKWNNNCKEKYQASISSRDFKFKLSSLIDTVENASCNDDLNFSISSFSDLMESVCTPLFGKIASSTTNTFDHKAPKFEFDNFARKREKHSTSI